MYSLFILVYRDILFVVCNFIGLENTQKEYPLRGKDEIFLMDIHLLLQKLEHFILEIIILFIACFQRL